MGEKCLRDELRSLFLFEKLNDGSCRLLCEDGHIEIFASRPRCVIEGEPASVAST